MKRSLILIAVLMIMGAGSPAMAQAPKGSKVIFMGSYFSNDGLVSDHHGGMSIGYQIKAWNGWVRTVVRQIQFASSSDPEDEDIEAIDISGLIDLSISERWSLYMLGGGSFNTDGQNQGLDAMIGLGADMRLWTFEEMRMVPGAVNIFGEFVFSDAETTGNYFQFNLGLSFTRPVE